MNDYEQYEEDCKRIREANEHLLNEFEAWLKSSGLSEKTINNHISNIAVNIRRRRSASPSPVLREREG
jgi:hypothetical protein